jgi:ribosomal protein S18 acetylase RimI-like enzyme
MSIASSLRVTEYRSAQHHDGCTDVLRAAFMHNHWPFFTRTTPRFARDAVALFVAIANVNLVLEDERGTARGFLCCASPLRWSVLLRALPMFTKMFVFSCVGLYPGDQESWKHFVALRRFLPLIRAHRLDPPHHEVIMLALSPSLRGRGWGSRLMNEAVVRAHASGGKRMHAMTDSTMSFSFYQHYGYERRATVELFDLYALAMGRHSEQGFVYTLDVQKKVRALEDRERATAPVVPTAATAARPREVQLP